MKFFLVFLIFSFLISKFESDKYYVYQYSVIRLDSNEIRYNCKCYRSRFNRIFNKDQVRIRTDSADFIFHIVKSNFRSTYFLSKQTLPYTMREINKNGTYYLIITPHIFNKKYLYGGDILAISNKKICE
jgi:hypothetical protein